MTSPTTPAPHRHSVQRSATSTGPRPPRVLLVEDEDSLRHLLRCILAAAHIEADEARNGHEALAMLRTNAYDWLVTDIVMPDCEGLELLRTVRQSFPSLPIIAMSGGGEGYAMDYLHCARLLGARHVLSKPFSHTELIAILRGHPPPPRARGGGGTS